MSKPSRYQLEVMTRQARNLRRSMADPKWTEPERRDLERQAEVLESALKMWRFDTSKVKD